MGTRTTLWTLLVLAMPVLYVLTVPPLHVWHNVYQDESGAQTWLQWYDAPFDWLYKQPALRTPIKAYDDWCWELLGPKMPWNQPLP